LDSFGLSVEDVPGAAYYCGLSNVCVLFVTHTKLKSCDKKYCKLYRHHENNFKKAIAKN